METKAKRKKRMASIIDRYNDGSTFSKQDCREASHLCGYQFEKITKIKHRMISVVCTSENHTGTWSWNKSIDGYNEGKNLLQAMRTASRKGSYSKHRGNKCEKCGNTDNLTVDHKSTPFSDIAKQYKKDYPDTKATNINGYGWVLRDELRFINYHDNIADYQTLCRSCNSVKSNK